MFHKKKWKKKLLIIKLSIIIRFAIDEILQRVGAEKIHRKFSDSIMNFFNFEKSDKRILNFHQLNNGIMNLSYFKN